MTAIDRWPLWFRATFWNLFAAGGVYLAIAKANSRIVSPRHVEFAVFAMACVNLLFLWVRPRVVAERAAGNLNFDEWSAIRLMFTERWQIFALLVAQVWSVSQLAVTGSIFATMYAQVTHRFVTMDERTLSGFERLVFLTCVFAVLYSVSAFGIWRIRPWAWRLALALNLLTIIFSVIAAFEGPAYFRVDVIPLAALLLLGLPSVRDRFGVTGSD